MILILHNPNFEGDVKVLLFLIEIKELYIE